MPGSPAPLVLPPHPRIFLTPERIRALRVQIAPGGDPVSARLYEHIAAVADGFLPLPPSTRVMEGRRLLAVSRAVLSRVLHLGLVAVLTDSERHARRAIDEILSAAAFTDWNPSHYLDTGEMTLALAVGYDWLHERMTPGERDRVADAIIDKGLRTSLTGGPENHWIDGASNWTQVCHAGIAAGALAIAERDPLLAAQLVERAISKMPRAAAAYAPDGAYAEGTMYWGYGTGFHVMLIDALTTALGHDGGLADAPGFLASAQFVRQGLGPSGKFFNYSDAREGREFSAPMFWFAQRLDDPSLVRDDLWTLAAGGNTLEARESGRMIPLALVWWRPGFTARLEEGAAHLPLHWRGRGEVPLGVHRSAWDDPRASYLALKGGCAAAPHGHMDGGAFVLEAGGVRWAADLGMQEYYSLESVGVNLWDGRTDGDRWKVFRVGGASHSILSFNGAPQLLRGRVPLIRFAGTGDWPHTVVDLGAIYADQTTRVWRGVSLGANGQFILQDEWATLADRPATVRWQMLTHAHIEISADGGTVTLRQDGQAFVLKVSAAAESRAEDVDVSQPVHPYDAPNPGARLLTLHTRTDARRGGWLRLVGTMAGTAAADLAAPAFRPLAEWSAPDPALGSV